jgi:hypothetical protein
MLTVIVKLFMRFFANIHRFGLMHPSIPHTSTFMPDAAIGGEVSAVMTLDGVTRSELTLGRANLSHGASAMMRR